MFLSWGYWIFIYILTQPFLFAVWQKPLPEIHQILICAYCCIAIPMFRLVISESKFLDICLTSYIISTTPYLTWQLTVPATRLIGMDRHSHSLLGVNWPHSMCLQVPSLPILDWRTFVYHSSHTLRVNTIRKFEPFFGVGGLFWVWPCFGLVHWHSVIPDPNALPKKFKPRSPTCNYSVHCRLRYLSKQLNCKLTNFTASLFKHSLHRNECLSRHDLLPQNSFDR